MTDFDFRHGLRKPPPSDNVYDVMPDLVKFFNVRGITGERVDWYLERTLYALRQIRQERAHQKPATPKPTLTVVTDND